MCELCVCVRVYVCVCVRMLSNETGIYEFLSNQTQAAYFEQHINYKSYMFGRKCKYI